MYTTGIVRVDIVYGNDDYYSSPYHDNLPHTTTMPEYGDRHFLATGRYWRSTTNTGIFDWSNTVGYTATGESGQPLKSSHAQLSLLCQC